MSSSAVLPDGLGDAIDRASPVLLGLLERAVDDLANHPLLKNDAPISNGTAGVPDTPASNDAPAKEELANSSKPVKGAKGKAGKQKPAAAIEVSTEAPPPLPSSDADVAASDHEAAQAAVKKKFDEQIEFIQAKAEADLLASLQLEEYLLQQHEAVEKATAAAMDAKDQQYTRFWRCAGVPAAPAKLELDSSRLEAAGLLDPTAVLDSLREKERLTVLNPPVTKVYSDNTAQPHYLANTAANTNRACMRQDAITRCKKSIREGKAFTWHSLPQGELVAAMKASRRRQKLSSMRMNGEQWDAERKVIQRIQEKLNFTRNPRFQDTVPRSASSTTMDPLLNRPQFGVGVVKKGSVPKPSLTSRRGTSFVCEPEAVVFTDWQPGHVHEATVQIRNVTATLQRVRVLPSASSFFHVSRLTFPAAEGVIAPGVHAEVRIKFTPDSLADFHDHMTVETESGPLTVHLTATRTPPVLDMDQQLSMGNVFVGSTMERRAMVRAHQGGGKFRLVPAGAWARRELDMEATGPISLPGGFTISPSDFSLTAGSGSVEVEFSFTPASQGSFTASYMLVCDNCHTKELTISGKGVEPGATVVSLDGVPCPAPAAPPAIRFTSTLPGTSAKRTLVVRNACSAPMPFRWAISNQSRTPDAVQTPSGSVYVLPERGVMEAHEEVIFDAIFTPRACGATTHFATLEMGPGAVSAPGERSAAGLCRLQLPCHGVAPQHPAAVFPRTLCAPETLEVGSTFAQSFVIKNPAAVPATFTIQGASEGAVAVSEQSGRVSEQSELTIQVVASAAAKLDLKHTLRVCIEHGLEFEVHVCANFALQLPVQVQTPGIDFGLVCRGTPTSAVVNLRNPSSCNTARWSVSCQPLGQAVAAVVAHEGSGTLQPQEHGAVELQCTGLSPGVFRAQVQISSCGSDVLVPIRAMVVVPRLTLGATTDSFELGTAYVGVPMCRQLELVNGADVPAKWRLRPALLGSGADLLLAVGQLQSGTLAARTRQMVEVNCTASGEGCVDSLLVVDVEHSENPVVIPVSCTAEGLQVAYSIKRGTQEAHTVDASVTQVTQALENGMIDFGQQILVGDVFELDLILTNSTAIEAPVDLRLEHFKAAVEGGSSERSGGEHTAGGRRQRGLLLGDDHERTSPFRAQAGRELLATRSVQEAARAMLVGRGIAIKLSRTHAVLPPFGSCTFHMQLMSNCVGSYLDRLHCSVGDLKPQMFWVRAGIIGSPVHVQREAVLVRGLHERTITHVCLDYGSVPQHVEVIKSFSVFNQSGFDVDVEFSVHIWEKRPGKRWVDVQLQANEDGHVQVAARAQTTTAEECAAFDIQPQRVQLGPGESGKVAVRFVSATAMRHEAFVSGKQTLRYHAQAVAANILSKPEGTPAEVVLRGSFHPHAGPPPAPLLPLRIDLSSRCIEPRLDHEHGRPLCWAIHSIHGPTAGSRQRTVTLCNRTASPLSFHLSTAGPFEVSNVVTSVPQEPRRFIGSTLFSQHEQHAAVASAHFLPSQESADVSLQCVLVAPKHGAKDCGAAGVLRVCFANGHVQEEVLEARVLHPRLQCKGRGGSVLHCVDFGRVAVGASRTIQIVLHNPSEVDAVWVATVCEGGDGAGAAADVKLNTGRGAEAPSEVQDSALSGFSVSPSSGVLHGSPAEQPCAQALVNVGFIPRSVGEYVKDLQFSTRGGTSCSVSLRATATLDEGHEPNWKLTELFQQCLMR